jgi:hypothetical protein
VILESLKEFAAFTSQGVGVKELCRIACQKDPQVCIYLGDKWSMEANKKVKKVFEIVRIGKRIEIVNMNPLSLRWRESDKDSSDLSDSYDLRKTDSVQDNNNNITETQNDEDHTPCISARSNRSDRSDGDKSIRQEIFGKPPARPQGYL